MEPKLADKAILITGAGKRVGAATGRLLHAHGACVAIHYRNSAADAKALAASLNRTRPSSAVALQADLLDSTSSSRLVEGCVDSFGKLNGLVCNASTFYETPVGRIHEEHWQDLMGTNLKAPLFLSQAAAPLLRASSGAVVNVTDIHADWPLKGFPLYCTAKSGLAGLTRALALELAPEVTVNAVAPGPILWPDDDTFSPKERADIIDHTLLKRCGEPLDVARAILFFLADAPFVTGQILAIDGGRSVHF